MQTHSGLIGGPQRITVRLIKKRPDKELVDALDTHAGLILRSAARVLGSMHEAQDVAQDLAEKLLRKPPKDVRSWPALLKTMAVNAAIDRTRRRRETGDAPEAFTEEGPDHVLGQEEKAAALRRALDQLSERDAQLFSFYYLADLSQADIGRQLNMSANAVSVALHRIRERLGTILSASEPGHALEGESS